MSTVRITVLVDNYVRRRGLLAEHGWACWVETPTGRLLFDTGQGLALLHNARELGIALERADAILLSHGHYDHTGGLAPALEACPAARVFAHPAALEPKYKRAPDGRIRGIGAPMSFAELHTRLAGRLVATRTPTRIAPDAWLTGEVPGATDFEPGETSFFLDAAGLRRDPLSDDQALVVRTADGAVVVLGCAHSGIINTLHYIGALHPGLRLAGILGGMHLQGAPVERVRRTAREFAALGIGRVCPAHCTGLSALATLAAEMAGDIEPIEVGASLEFAALHDVQRGAAARADQPRCGAGGPETPPGYSGGTADRAGSQSPKNSEGSE
ncbi:MAG: MBL fold metallo-hydrolase [Phycisphaerae bacterium]|jgi:7,8-dihydropterin-6-yl-methyl-4-(beta-D-ribofuranosyl)aminobenzene 5'-phosphate synthase|nr:MBL fold metallo-hydrolase [Phycisphaerae bacterium]HOO17942.1 MBL fold metallo-hydrolase [Phycisphaerae bacterium]HPC23677.1 MBL fold metallo-hydrolase [Phycisphaerae bacterium]HRS29514.1 MBL fold metallo-hydrolase [Phycisphaerae bacterium]HRT43252.1 MBL fold metallo-hydrolase [Phycisphaerae bacterium]